MRALIYYAVCDIVYAIPHLSEDARPRLCRFVAQGPVQCENNSAHHVWWGSCWPL